MFSQRKLMRRWVAQMLLMWLFALTTGIVNACVIERELGLAHDMSAVEHERPSSLADNPLCAKFCADESVSAPVLKQQSDPQTTIWLEPPPTVSMAVQAALEPVRAHDTQRAPEHLRVPIPIAFLRLTL